MANTKKQYILEGLCCGNCAAKIQTETLVKDITRIAVSHDEDIFVKEA